MSEVTKPVRKKAANRRMAAEPTIQKPKGEVTTTTVKHLKSGKTKTTVKKTNLNKKAGGRPKSDDGSYSQGQRIILAYLLGKKATIAARAVDRDMVWKNISGHKSSCQTLRDKGLMERIKPEGGNYSLYLTKEGVEVAKKLDKEPLPQPKIKSRKTATKKGTKKTAKKRAAKK